jgi:uncharacterized protein with HEPN domain
MLDHAREAVAIMRGKSRHDLDTDRLLQLAITRVLEITGEAANRVTREGRARYVEIGWQDIIGNRNRIIHAYNTVAHDIVWQILSDALPTLIAALERATPGHQS